MTVYDKLQIFQTLADASYDALLVVDHSYRILVANSQANMLFSNEDVVDQNLISLAGLSEIENALRDVFDNREEMLEAQVTINERPHRVRTRRIHQDNVILATVTIQDVTELVRLNRARRDMVANISHELRTPIANIRLILDELFDENDKPKRKRSISALQAIELEIDSLQWIMQEILDLSMIESGQAILRMTDTRLDHLVQEVVERMLDQSREKAIKIHNKVPSDIEVLCDVDQTKRVFINLIHNAIKWTPRGGEIRIKAFAQDEDVVIKIIDDGPGVSEDQVDRIFERFYQVDASRSGNEGSGLGLSICKHIVEAHGGRIWAVSNQVKSGGRFVFTLPAADTTNGNDH
ncbi:MAG: sensor histidine kinase [Chloroflexi bacterium]|nr:MAG: sensor histidine kinase [Chloroflexota bacterium]